MNRYRSIRANSPVSLLFRCFAVNSRNAPYRGVRGALSEKGAPGEVMAHAMRRCGADRGAAGIRSVSSNLIDRSRWPLLAVNARPSMAGRSSKALPCLVLLALVRLALQQLEHRLVV